MGIRRRNRERSFNSLFTTKTDGRLIGNCGVRLPAPGARIADIGYELNPDEWGHGYATEAARAILDFGFAEFPLLRRAWASCVVENTASAHVLAKVGMHRAPRLRDRQYFRQAYPEERLTGEEEGFTWEDWMITRQQWQRLHATD